MCYIKIRVGMMLTWIDNSLESYISLCEVEITFNRRGGGSNQSGIGVLFLTCFPIGKVRSTRVSMLEYVILICIILNEN